MTTPLTGLSSQWRERAKDCPSRNITLRVALLQCADELDAALGGSSPASLERQEQETGCIPTKAGNYCPTCYHPCDRCSHCDTQATPPLPAREGLIRELAQEIRYYTDAAEGHHHDTLEGWADRLASLAGSSREDEQQKP